MSTPREPTPANLRADAVVKRRRAKYGNTKTVVDGISFDSKAEARRYGELKLLERAGEIRDLELQPKFDLFGIGAGKICTYKADFKYNDLTTFCLVVEDVKSPSTAKEKAYRLKAKLFADNFGFAITEVSA